MPIAWRLARPTMLALPMSPGFSASWAWMRACSSAAFLAFSMASFMKVAAWEGWIVLPIGSRSGWEDEGVFGCEIEKKKSASEKSNIGRQISLFYTYTNTHTHTGGKLRVEHAVIFWTLIWVGCKKRILCLTVFFSEKLGYNTWGVGGLMKLSCFFLSSICRVAASIICLICSQWGKKLENS